MNSRQQIGKKAALIALGLSAVVTWKQPLIAQAQGRPGGPSQSGEGRRFSGPDGRRGPGGRRGLSLERLKSELGLTAQQQAKIKPILDSATKRMQTLRQNTSLSREEARSRMRQIMTETQSRISTVLTAKQKQKLAEMRQRGPGFGPRGSGGPRFGRGFGSPAERLQRLDQAVKLTSKQKAQLKPVMEQAAKRMTALQNNTKLSPEKRREQARSISDSVRKTMDKVLTSTQKQKMATLRRERGRRGFGRGPGQRTGPGRSNA
jgi:Spy/CpxP family protein refolding chaperone